MNQKIKNTLLVVVATMAIAGAVLAAPPATKYLVGETTDPTCAPGDANCTVEIPGENGVADEPWFGTDDDAGATTNTEDIYTMGNVGIGTTAPTFILDVFDAGSTRLHRNRGTITNNAPLVLASSYSGGVGAVGLGSRLSFQAETATEGILNNVGFVTFSMTDATTGSVDSDFHLTTISNGVTVELITGLSDGSIGIGTTSPETRLHITSSGDSEITLEQTGTTAVKWKMINSEATGKFELVNQTDGITPFKVFKDAQHDQLRLTSTETIINSNLTLATTRVGTTDAVAPGALVGALCITDNNAIYIDTDGTCAN